MPLRDDEMRDLLMVKAHAATHVLSVEDMKATMRGEKRPLGYDPAFVVTLPRLGLRMVFSEEMQPVLGRCRHASISWTCLGVEKSREEVEQEAKKDIPEVFAVLGFDRAREVLDWDEPGVAGGLVHHMLQPVEPFIVCPKCARPTFNPVDIANEHCPACGSHGAMKGGSADEDDQES